MADFDPYHRWLGIAKEQRPPNHYQLLGVPVGEADREVIEEAAVRQTAHVRTYQIGQHAADCARILNEIAVEDDFVRLRQGQVCYTKQAFSGPLEITVVARTQLQNIRLHAFKGACVIFNWEGKMNELRVNRPDGNDNRESGSLTTAPVEPLAANTWHTLRWRIDVQGMEIIANHQTVFLERRANNLADARKVGIGAMTSLVDVRAFDVKPLQGALGDP